MRSTLYTLLLLLLACGCTSTEIIQPENQETNNRVTLNISAPRAYNFGNPTRALEGHQMRLTARLYSAGSTTPMEKREVTYTSAETTLSFTIDDPGEYFVTVFADYIPTNTQVVDGHYADKYYDTSDPKTITVIADKGDFFNNVARDCFAGKVVFTKGLQAVDTELRLTRPISMIQLAVSGTNIENLASALKVTACSYLSGYSFNLDNTSTTGALATDTPTSIKPENENATVKDPTDNLFFFYTFAGDRSDETRPTLGEIAFSLTEKDNAGLTANTFNVASGLIKPAQNYKVIVQGGTTWITSNPGGDDITLIFSGTEYWKE